MTCEDGFESGGEFFEPTHRHLVSCHPDATAVIRDTCKIAVFEHSKRRLVLAELRISVHRICLKSSPFQFGESQEISRTIKVRSELNLLNRFSSEISDAP